MSHSLLFLWHRIDKIIEENKGSIEWFAYVFGTFNEIAQDAISRFQKGEVDKVVLLYNQFISTLTQKPYFMGLERK